MAVVHHPDREGRDGGAPLPPVTFAGTALPNRIESQAELNDGYSVITRQRLTSITNETGGVTTVNYLAPSGGCTSGTLPAPDANTLLCYPDYWSPSTGSPAIEDWFNKYAVHEVTEQDTTGNQPDVVTTYSYGGAAWHYDDDALTRSSQRTWDQWRGFRTVTTETGPATSPDTKTVDTYLQGMNGDYQSDGSTSSVSLTSTQGNTVTDDDQFTGMDFEHVTDNGPSGAMVTDKITIPWTSAATATQSQPSPLPALNAYLTGTAETDTYTALAAGGNRKSTVTYTHDSDGRVTTESSVPDTGDASEDTCTTTTYASNTSAWIMDLPSEVTVVSVPCGTTPALPADAVSDNLTFYDGATSLTSDTPATGNVTETQEATSYNGSTPVYTTESQSTYDEYGRVLTAENADSDTTTTAYTPATGAEPTSVKVTGPAPADLVTTTTYDPLRDLPLTVTSPAGWTSTREYDALGRLTAAWTDGHTTGGSPQYKYSYDVSDTAPSVVTTQTIEPDGTDYLPSETIYDSLGRAAETQDENANGNTVVTDTYYNSDGWTVKTSGPFATSGAPVAKLVQAADGAVPAQTVDVYDGTGRVTASQSYSLANETWETDTAYGGDYTTTTYQNFKSGEPDGGTPETVFTNGEGQTSKIYQYHSEADAALGISAPASDYDTTSYGYTPAGKLASITDDAGNTWTYKYNLAGNQTLQTDPDSGTTTSAYDAAGLLKSVTDARNDQISYTYDADGRKTAEYDTTGGATESSSDELASWTYDTLAKGELSSSTSYYDGNAYTENVIGYDGYGVSDGTETVIPPAEGKLAGNYIHETKTVNPATDQVETYEDSADGGLPQETAGWSYNAAGNPTSVTGNWTYVDSLSYSDLGDPLKYTYGTTSEPAWTTDSYDEQTGALTEQATQTGTTPVTVDDQHYSYDNTGQVLSDADTPSSGKTQVQCFQYDYLGRLSQAWSQSSSSCSPGPSQTAEATATAPYWEQYGYDNENNLKSETSTPASGPATTTTDTYPLAGSAQPHGISSQTVTTSSGSAQTTYGYNADGDLTATSGTQSQSLTWDDAGRLSQLTTSSGTTGYIYDADGNLLLRKDPGSTTLYLADEEITLTGSTLSGTRYYSIGGVTVAARSSAGGVQYLTGDQQGTQTLAVDSSNLAVSERFYDPYGNPADTATGTWPGDKGFQNGSADTSTGLDDLGAREYNPGTASFVSPDPLLKPTDPQDLNPYAYAQDEAPSLEDPTGQCSSSAGMACLQGQGGPVIPPEGGGKHGSNIGKDPISGSSGDNYNGGSNPSGRSAAGHSDGTGGGAPDAYVLPVQVRARYVSWFATWDGRDTAVSPEGILSTLNAFCGISQYTKLCGETGVHIRNYWWSLGEATVGFANEAIPNMDVSPANLAAEDDIAMLGCGESFTPSTTVLLADGKTIAISGLKPGDKVLATNTKTGKTSPETVAAVEINHDTDLYDLRVKSAHGVTVIHTTSNHLFWDPARHQWVQADRLRKGEPLKTANGTTAVADGGAVPANRDGWMWDLTIPGNNDHDFYVLAATGTPSAEGVAALLVHNQSAGCPHVNYDAIPENLRPYAEKVINQMDENGDLPPGVRQGGSRAGPGIYGGEGLPAAPPRYYVETDILPTPDGGDRMDGRLVFGLRGEVWYTSHYKDGFVQIRGPFCGC